MNIENITTSKEIKGNIIVIAFGSAPSGSMNSFVFLNGVAPALKTSPDSALFWAFSIGPKSNCVYATYPTIASVSQL